MPPKELWAKLCQFLVFVLHDLHVRWPQRLQRTLRYLRPDSNSPSQKLFFLFGQQNDKMTSDRNPSPSSLEIWCQRWKLPYWCFPHKSSGSVASLPVAEVQFDSSCLLPVLHSKNIYVSVWLESNIIKRAQLPLTTCIVKWNPVQYMVLLFFAHLLGDFSSF